MSTQNTSDIAEDPLATGKTEVTNTIVRIVRNIRRNRTPREAVDATGRQQHVDNKVLKTMPVGDGPEEVELVYVCPGRLLLPAEQTRFLEEQGLVSDPQAQMADNEHDPAFADKHPNGFHWDYDGQVISVASFGRLLDGERVVEIYRKAYDWPGDWWLAGVREVTRLAP